MKSFKNMLEDRIKKNDWKYNLTPIEGLEAIRARISGEFDNPILMKYGSLNHDPIEDISRIVEEILHRED